MIVALEIGRRRRGLTLVELLVVVAVLALLLGAVLTMVRPVMKEMKVRDSILKRLKAEEMKDYILEVLVPMEKVVEGIKSWSDKKIS